MKPAATTAASHLVIVGGGIAGLSAAYYACQKAANEQQPVNITILEQADYWGGKIVTDRIPHDDGQFVIEGGPDTMVATKPWGVRLARELGLAERLRGTNPKTRKTYILKKGRLHELPGGLTMMIPTEIAPMVRTGLLSWPAKARMGLDFLLPAAPPNGDETLGAFVTRRLGRAAYENLIEPLMSGIYAGDGDQLSLQSTFPYLRDLELKHGGLVKGALALRRERQRKASTTGAAAGAAAQSGPGQGAPATGSIFLTPTGGLAELVEALVKRLQTCGVVMRLNAPVRRLERNDNVYTLWIHGDDTQNDQRLHAQAVVLATPAFLSAALLENFAPDLAAELRPIEYVSTATVTLAYREADLPQPLDGYGYVIPRREDRKALACTWTSTKFPHRAPEGYALLRVFVGRAGQEGEISWDEDALLADAQDELRRTMGVTAQPLLARIFCWEKAMPQYNLGHPDRLKRIEAMQPAYPGLTLAGAAYQGIGVPDCIHSGELAAEKAMDVILGGGQAAVETALPETAYR